MNARLVDISGQKFGRWTVLSYVGPAPGTTLWLCRCECGIERNVGLGNLKAGRSQSCGCLQREKAHKIHFRHGQLNHPIYTTWAGIKNRCRNQNDPDFKHYGGRGITVCDRWLLDFWNFWEDMAAKWRPGLTIERLDVDGNYEPANCCWVTQSQQIMNMRRRETDEI